MDNTTLVTLAKKLLLIAVVLAAPVYILVMVCQYGSPVPYWDQWEFVPTLEKMHAHQLTLADIWQQHNEHRIFFPRLVMVSLAAATGWNIWYELAANYVTACLTFILLFMMLRKTFAEGVPPWLLLAFSVIVFSPMQSENWLWGWQIQIFMTVLGTVLSIWGIQRWPGAWKGLATGIAGAVLASYSFSNGLFTWVVVIPILALGRTWERKHLVAWLCAFAAAAGLHFATYSLPVNHQPLGKFMEQPVEFAKYVLMYTGSPLGAGIGRQAAVCSAVTIIMCIVLPFMLRKDRKRLDELLPWLALAAYVIIGASVTAIGRLGIGAGQAMSPRYITLASPLLLAAMVCLAVWVQARRTKNQQIHPNRLIVLLVLMAAFIAGCVCNFATGTSDMRERGKYMASLQSLLNVYSIAPDEALAHLYPKADVLRQRAKALADMGIVVPKQPPANR